ncbi:MAG: carboxypeptidase regulatory-like domain-containing protein, partial [Planctomycetes bacterium]|nr:carboxypeptidase regulatory-like domain-containing protein [Planctomycetota bacterium]
RDRATVDVDGPRPVAAKDPGVRPAATDPPPSWLTGRVVDADGQAIPDAEVFLLVERFGTPAIRREAVTRTDAHGDYVFTGEADPADLWAWVVARADGFVMGGARLPDSWPHAPFIELERGERHPFIVDARWRGELPLLELKRGRRVVGRALLPDGVDASTGEFRFTDSSLGPSRWLADEPFVPQPIDADGRFETWVSADIVDFLACWRSSAGDRVAWGRVWLAFEKDEAAESESVDLPLQWLPIVHGRLVDEEGDPVVGATVATERPAWILTTSGASGSFALLVDAPEDESIEFVIDHPEFQTQWISAPSELDTTRENPWMVTLLHARWNWVDFTPIPSRSPLWFDSEGIAWMRVGSRYRSWSLESEAKASWATFRGFLPSALSWPEGVGEHDCGTIPLDRGRSLVVWVRDAEGQPISEATVAADLLVDFVSTEADVAGRAELAGLPDGVASIVVEADEFVSVRESVDLAMGSEITIVLEREAAISFVVADPGGPLSGATARLAGEYGGESDADGRIVTAVSPGRSVEITLSAEDHLPTTLHIDPLSPGEERDLGVVHLDPGASLLLRVLDH